MNANEMEGTPVVAQCDACGGVFMPRHFSSSVGAGMVGKTYTAWRPAGKVVRFRIFAVLFATLLREMVLIGMTVFVLISRQGPITSNANATSFLYRFCTADPAFEPFLLFLLFGGSITYMFSTLLRRSRLAPPYNKLKTQADAGH